MPSSLSVRIILLVITLLCSDPLMAAPKPVAKTPVISAETPGHRLPIKADLRGAQQLYLVVLDAGDGFSCDWADWIAPQLTGSAGTLDLTKVKWKSAGAGWGQVRINRNTAGKPLRVNGEPVEVGIGTHANSVIRFDVPEGYDQFSAECGLDNGGTDQKNGATVQFFVYTEDPKITDGNGLTRTPDEAVTLLDTPDDVESTLIAAEPTLLSPSTIDVDHLGRVWVAEVVNYRRFANKDRQDREEGDRILVLEDTTGDGLLDTSHTFYQGRDVDSAHGICVLGNRIIVSALDKVINFYDDNGDLKPDRKEVMFSGIDGAQHDHGIHSFTFGPDGRLYFNFGNAGNVLHTPDGEVVTDIAGNEVKANRQPYQQGMAFRCDLDGSHVETLGWNFRNNWELAVDSYGAVWQSDNDDDGNRATRINFVMEYGNYGYRDELTGAGWRQPRSGMETTIPEQHWHLNDPGVVPNLLITGAGAPCGIEVYEASLLPERFHNQLVHCEAGVNIVRSYAVAADGAGYQATINPLLTGVRDRWFRPCDVSLAADGSLIIADWYDPGVGGHRQGDVDRGRLFRLAPPHTPWTHPRFDFSTIEGAIAGLLSCNRDARYQAWQKLANAGRQAEPALEDVFRNHADPRMRARALWLLARIEGRSKTYIKQGVLDENENIRIVAIRLARQLEEDFLPSVINDLRSDRSPAVRRACIIALCNMPPQQRVDQWVELARQLPAGDRWYLEALGIAARGLWDQCGAALMESRSSDLDANVADDLLWRSRSESSARLIKLRIEALVTAGADGSRLGRWFRALDFQDRETTHNAMAGLLRGVTKTPAGVIEPATRSYLVSECLTRLQPQLIEHAETNRAVVNTVLDEIPEEQRIGLIQRFRLSERYPELLQTILNRPGTQQASDAVQALVRLKQTDRLTALFNDEDVDTRQSAITAAGSSRNSVFTSPLLNLMNTEEADPESRRNAVRAALRIKDAAEEIVKLIKSQELDSDLQPAVAAALHGSPDEQQRQLGREHFPLPEGKAGEQLPPLSELVKRQGDAKKGRLVFNTTGTCFKCHVVNRIGRALGPDLSEIGSKLSREAMLESVLFPSAGIAHNYDTWTAVLASGTTVTGLKLSETDEELVIIDNEAIQHRIASNELEELIRQKVSMMPADLQKIMTTQELVDVVSWLETLRNSDGAPAK